MKMFPVTYTDKNGDTSMVAWYANRSDAEDLIALSADGRTDYISIYLDILDPQDVGPAAYAAAG